MEPLLPSFLREQHRHQRAGQGQGEPGWWRSGRIEEGRRVGEGAGGRAGRVSLSRRPERERETLAAAPATRRLLSCWRAACARLAGPGPGRCSRSPLRRRPRRRRAPRVLPPLARAPEVRLQLWLRLARPKNRKAVDGSDRPEKGTAAFRSAGEETGETWSVLLLQG